MLSEWGTGGTVPENGVSEKRSEGAKAEKRAKLSVEKPFSVMYLSRDFGAEDTSYLFPG